MLPINGINLEICRFNIRIYYKNRRINKSWWSNIIKKKYLDLRICLKNLNSKFVANFYKL